MTIKWFVNTIRPDQKGRDFDDEKFIFSSIEFLLNFVPRGQNDIKSALVRVMGERRLCNKRLSEAMVIQFTDAYHLASMYY